MKLCSRRRRSLTDDTCPLQSCCSQCLSAPSVSQQWFHRIGKMPSKQADHYRHCTWECFLSVAITLGNVFWWSMAVSWANHFVKMSPLMLMSLLMLMLHLVMPLHLYNLCLMVVYCLVGLFGSVLVSHQLPMPYTYVRSWFLRGEIFIELHS